MMFTLAILYVTLYIIIFLGLTSFCIMQIPTTVLTSNSTTVSILFLQKYCSTKNIFLLLLFSLTGLPPVGLFFIKFNILVFIFYETHIIGCLVIFMLFFVNMLYYTQLFNSKNVKNPIYSIIENQVITNFKYSSFLTNSSSYQTFKVVNLWVNILIFMLITILLCSDLIVIFLS